MLRNFKKSVLFVLMIMLLFLLVVTSLATAKPISQTEIKNILASADLSIEGLENKWSGLGMCTFSSYSTALFDTKIDEILANGFTEIRLEITDWDNSAWLTQSKACIPRAVAKGAKVIWGISSMVTTLTAANWTDYADTVKSAATWAQANGVFEFQIGNEAEWHIDGTTLTLAELLTNLKSLATEVQELFTSGNVSYTCGQSNWIIAAWAAAGRGDIDIIASNIYKGGAGEDYDLSYQGRIDDLVNAFGAEHTYITEFGPSYTSLDHYSEDETVQAEAVSEMLNYIEASGITRAYYYNYRDDMSGAMCDSTGTYRLLWDVLTGTDSTIPDTPEQTDETTQETILDTTVPNITGLSNDTTPTDSNETNSSSVGLSSSKGMQQYEDPVKAFVARFYQECLSRDPDNGGLNGWADKLTRGSTTGAKVAYGFIFSDEFKQKSVSNEEYITILYIVCFNREPDSGGYNRWLDHLNNGKSRKWVLAGFIKSKEFKNLCAAYGIKPGSV